MSGPEGPPASEPSPLDRVVDDQALAVLAAIDDLRHDLPGSVHDARVALRKLRSTLTVFGALLDPESAGRIEEGLRWFGGELSGARDAQVVRSRVTAAIHGQPDADAGADELLSELDLSTAGTWERAQAALDDPRLKELVTALEQARLRSLAVDTAPVSVLDRLGGSLSLLVERAQTTVSDALAADERLHSLRKRVKRVRFAVTSLRDSTVEALPPGSGAGRVAHALEELQDLLGEYQDAIVTAGILDRIGSQAPRLAALAADLAASQRDAASVVRDSLPAGVDRVRRAARRLQRRTPGVHLDSP